MAELRTIVLRASGSEATEKLLVEKTMRIKKIEVVGFFTHTAAGTGNVIVGKRETQIESKRHGDLVFLYVIGLLVNAGTYKGVESVVVDLGADYIEIEEDDYLYVYVLATVGTITGTAIIYYEE